MVETGHIDYAKSFDNEVAEIAEKNNCVVTTWLSPWIVKEPTIRVWVSASLDERARRYAEREKLDIKKATEMVKKKDDDTTKWIKEIYDIDVKNHSFFDMMINTEKLSINESVAIISLAVMLKEKSRFK